MALTVYTDNTVSLNNRLVGRLDKRDAQPMRHPRPIRFYTGDVGSFDKVHEIGVPLYIRGKSPSDWLINPEFEAAVARIIE